jgi:hypothetical protein
MRATDSYRTIRPRNIDPSGEPVCEATYVFAQLSKCMRLVATKPKTG